jgi:hypothetical protein
MSVYKRANAVFKTATDCTGLERLVFYRKDMYNDVAQQAEERMTWAHECMALVTTGDTLMMTTKHTRIKFCHDESNWYILFNPEDRSYSYETSDDVYVRFPELERIVPGLRHASGGDTFDHGTHPRFNKMSHYLDDFEMEGIDWKYVIDSVPIETLL